MNRNGEYPIITSLIKNNGLRLTEVLNLTPKDVALTNNFILLKVSSMGKTRIAVVPLNHEMWLMFTRLIMPDAKYFGISRLAYNRWLKEQGTTPHELRKQYYRENIDQPDWARDFLLGLKFQSRLSQVGMEDVTEDKKN